MLKIQPTDNNSYKRIFFSYVLDGNIQPGHWTVITYGNKNDCQFFKKYFKYWICVIDENETNDYINSMKEKAV